MIYELKNTPPLIDFGFGVTEKIVNAGQTATIWLNTLYNQEVYSTGLIAHDADVTQISDYEYRVVYNTKGTYPISLGVGSTSRKISLQSNSITLTVQ